MTITETFALVDDLIDTTTEKYPLAAKARSINRNQDKLVNIILENDPNTLYDDFNYGDTTEDYINLVSGQSVYDFQSDLGGADVLYVIRVLAKDSAGVYQPLSRHGTTHPNALYNLRETYTGSPRYWRFNGNRIILSYTPNYNSTNGLKVIYQREPKAITAADTTRELGLPSTFHHLIALMTAYDYARAKNLVNKNDLLNEINEEKVRLGIYISNLDKETYAVIRPVYRNPR